MSRTRNTTLKTAKQYSALLLYEATGGIMGIKPVGGKKVQGITFAEKKALLTELLKLSELEHKHKLDEPEQSPFAMMKMGVKNGRIESDNTGSPGDSGESIADESDTDSEPESE